MRSVKHVFSVTVSTFCRYSPRVRADIGRYACLHGNAAAARYFTRKLGHPIQASTIHSIKKAFKDERGKKRADDDDEDVRELPHKKRGRPFILGEDLDKKLQQYLFKVSLLLF